MSRYKSNKKSRSKIKILVSLVLLILLLGGALTYYFVHRSDKAVVSTTKFYVPASPADNTPNNARKGSSSPAQTLNGSPTSSTGSNTTGTFTVSIGSPVINSGNVHIGDMVSGITSGDCTLTATKQGSSSVTLATAQVKQDVNYYDCGVFNISTSMFPSTGTWTITLTVTSNGTQVSNSSTADITSN